MISKCKSEGRKEGGREGGREGGKDVPARRRRGSGTCRGCGPRA
jgi:hypothetical protein